MADQPRKTLDDLVRHVGRFPEEAFLFVREGLAFTVEQAHGPESDAHRELFRYMLSENLDWAELHHRVELGEVPDRILSLVDSVGGCERLNRHVSGRQLCWGLRDYAFQCWGMLAKAVLESWGVRETLDFGRIVFGFIDLELMQKQSDDSIDDFVEVYRFDEAFDGTFRGNGDSREERRQS